MPWVRIDENAMEHPKVGGLSDGAFRLWVQGLAYCQKFLTDGAIVDVSLRGLRAYSPKRRSALEGAGLWEQRPAGGVAVHDYLDWNESRDHVLRARQFARERMAKSRNGSREQRENFTVSDGERSPNVPSGVCGSGSAPKERGAGKTARLAFGGKALDVPKFLDDEFVKRLNGHAFDLTQFYLALDAQLVASGEAWDLRWIREQFAKAAPQPAREAQPRKAVKPQRKYWADECREVHGGTCTKRWDHETLMLARQAGDQE